jgi:hypothetical protein
LVVGAAAAEGEDVVLGTAVLGAAAAAPFVAAYVVDEAAAVAQRPDADEISRPGGLAPDMSPDGGAGPMQLPSSQPATPAIDPNTGQPVTLPTDQNPVPASDPSDAGSAQLPGQPDNGGGPLQATPREPFFDLDEAASDALGEKAEVTRRVEDIGPVDNAGVREALRRLGYDPNEFRAVQYEATCERGNFIFTVFEAEGGVWYGPHISSVN